MNTTMTWERLAAMVDNGNSLYYTPGDTAGYWGSRPNFRDDYRVGSPEDFTDAGFEFCREPDDDPGDGRKYLFEFDPQPVLLVEPEEDGFAEETASFFHLERHA